MFISERDFGCHNVPVYSVVQYELHLAASAANNNRPSPPSLISGARSVPPPPRGYQDVGVCGRMKRRPYPSTADTHSARVSLHPSSGQHCIQERASILCRMACWESGWEPETSNQIKSNQIYSP